MWLIMNITYKIKGSIVIADLSVSVTLYAKVPVAGRVQLTTIRGSLKGQGITAKINVKIAQGTATLYVKQNSSGNHDLYIRIQLKVKFIGNIGGGEYKLVTLPYVYFFGNFYTGSADLASLDSKWVLISCSI
jgi:hypothetical protein